eukprot:UN27117
MTTVINFSNLDGKNIMFELLEVIQELTTVCSERITKHFGKIIFCALRIYLNSTRLDKKFSDRVSEQVKWILIILRHADEEQLQEYEEVLKKMPKLDSFLTECDNNKSSQV